MTLATFEIRAIIDFADDINTIYRQHLDKDAVHYEIAVRFENHFDDDVFSNKMTEDFYFEDLEVVIDQDYFTVDVISEIAQEFLETVEENCKDESFYSDMKTYLETRI